MWDAINDSRTRPAHAAMDGHVAPIDAPIWKKWHSPPCGHNCRCTRISLSEAQARARGYPKEAPNVEPDKGWEGDPTEGNEDLVRVVQARQDSCAFSFATKRRGRGLWCDEGPARDRMRAMATALDHDAPMPEPRATGLYLLPSGQSRAFYLQRVMEALGDSTAKEMIIASVPGYPLSVSEQMFTDHKTGESKIDKRGRSAYLLYLAETIKRPDEAWLREGSFGDRTLTLLARFLVRGRSLPIVAIFKEDGAFWSGWSGYNAPQAGYIDRLRAGILVHRRPET